MPSYPFKLIIGILCLFFLDSCRLTYIPSQTPKYVNEVSDILQQQEKFHVDFIHFYFDCRTSDINEYVETVWLPSILTSQFNEPNLANLCNEIVQNGGNLAEYLKKNYSEIHTLMLYKQSELINPLHDLETIMIYNTRREYSKALLLNLTVFSYLSGKRPTERLKNSNDFLSIKEYNKPNIHADLEELSKEISALKQMDTVSLKNRIIKEKEIIDNITSKKKKIETADSTAVFLFTN